MIKLESVGRVISLRALDGANEPSDHPASKESETPLSSQELIRSGRLAEAKAALQLEVKDNPQDYRLRTSLFELLCVIGEWQRADHTLAVMADESVEVAEGVVLYRKLLAAEAKRREFLAGGAPPTLPLGDAALGPYLEAIRLLADGKPQEAAAMLDQAESSRPAVSGVRSGVPFSDLRDADDRFAAVLEAHLGDEYVWLPLAKLHSLRVYPPTKLRDLMFAPAMVDWGQGVRPVFVPVRYPGSEHDPRSDVQLARMTTTRTELAEPVLGLGQRVLLVGDAQVSLLALDLVQLDGGKQDGPAA